MTTLEQRREVERLALELCPPGPGADARYLAQLNRTLHRLRRFLLTEHPDPGLTEDLLALWQRGHGRSDPRTLLEYLALAHHQVRTLHASPSLRLGEWDGEQVSTHSSDVPGMITSVARRYYRWLGRQLTGAGAAVELGAWLGCVTCCLAEGMRAGGADRQARLYAVDAFQWQPSMGGSWVSAEVDHVALAQPGALFAGFRNNVAPFGELVVPVQAHFGAGTEVVSVARPGGRDGRRGDASRQSFAPHWSGQPIELLLYDMGPNAEILDQVWRIYAPHLIPQRSFVVFQEYGQLRATALWRFCADRAASLRPEHKPIGSAKAFRFLGENVDGVVDAA